MKKVVSLAVLFILLSVQNVFCCTNFLITKGASADGSTMISYSADSHGMYGSLYFRKAASHDKGAMRPVYEWDSGKYLRDIPEASHTYQRVGNINEMGVIIGETTYGGREDLWDFECGGLDYGSLIYIALERSASAREAIEVIVSLADEYGYVSEGESFSIADKNEVWVMDLIGRGKGKKGIVWVARRVPDGYICGHANQARITTFPLNDKENCLYAEDVISLARGKGYFSGKDKDFSFADAYNPLDFSGMRACEARVWSGFNILGEGKFTYLNEKGKEVTDSASKYLDYAMGYNAANRFPLFIKPAKPVSVKMLADVMRDHFEGTPMDMTKDIGAGGNALPYRWRPMSWEYNGKTYINERAIATQQTAFWFVAQVRNNVPDVIAPVTWFGTDDAATSYLTPIYACVSDIPECYREGNGDISHYAKSSFWINNRVANDCYKMYNQMAPEVRKEIDTWENKMAEEIVRIDAEATELYNAALAKQNKFIRRVFGKKNPTEDPLAAVKEYVTSECVGAANTMFEYWCNLEERITVKFIDGNVLTEEGKILHPEYTEYWKKATALDHGKVLEAK
ncbi:MAG: C69 family dipeptidase [Bacteroidales bacterium]|nr:C69 family dipeptidase [Bacteroidales bacterium]